MHYQQDIGQCKIYARKAIALLAHHALPATPHNYALWFTYVVGEIKELSSALDQFLASGRPLTHEECEQLYDQYLSNRAVEDAMFRLGSGITDELNTVQQLLQTASRDTSTYGDTLEGVSGQLTKTNDAALLKVVIDNLATATRSMAQRSKKLEERLEQSRGEISALQENIEAIRVEARTDQLTALSNREAFDESLERAFERSRADAVPLSLIIGDIDHFKKFNDTWGHQTGDQVLRLVSHCMRESVRPTDTAARYGGEEFAVILSGAPLARASEVAERIRASVESKRVMKRSTGEDLGTITMSFGVATLRPGEGSSELVQRADACLYVAKRSGRNRIVTDEAMPADQAGSAESDTGRAAG